jgi:hypothetical protein
MGLASGPSPEHSGGALVGVAVSTAPLTVRLRRVLLWTAVAGALVGPPAVRLVLLWLEKVGGVGP